MANLRQANVYVQVRIKEETEVGQFNSSLYFTLEEFEKITEEELAAKKQERVDGWVDIVKNPPPFVEPTPEELQEQIDSLEEQKQSLISQRETILTKPLVREVA